MLISEYWSAVAGIGLHQHARNTFRYEINGRFEFVWVDDPTNMTEEERRRNIDRLREVVRGL